MVKFRLLHAVYTFTVTTLTLRPDSDHTECQRSLSLIIMWSDEDDSLGLFTSGSKPLQAYNFEPRPMNLT